LLKRLRDVLRGLTRQTPFREEDLAIFEELHVDAGATAFIIAELARHHAPIDLGRFDDPARRGGRESC
jgi:hypothetical protein